MKDRFGRPLSKRERQVLKILTLGKNNEEIAQELLITKHTVKAHISSILNKMGVNDRLQAVLKAIEKDRL